MLARSLDGDINGGGAFAQAAREMDGRDSNREAGEVFGSAVRMLQKRTSGRLSPGTRHNLAPSAGLTSGQVRGSQLPRVPDDHQEVYTLLLCRAHLLLLLSSPISTYHQPHLC